MFSTQDAHGPIRHGLVLASCSTLQVLGQLSAVVPQLGTLATLLNAPPQSQVCPTSSQPVAAPAARTGVAAARRRRREAAADAEAGSDARSHPRHGRLRAVVLRAAAVPVAGLRRPDPAQAEGLPLPRRRSARPASWPRRPTSASPACSVGKVKDITADKQTGRTRRDDRARARSYAPLPKRRAARSCARRRCWARPTSSSRRATRRRARIPENGTLAAAQVSPTVELDEIFRAFDPRRAPPSRRGCSAARARLKGRGQDINDALGNLAPFARTRRRCCRSSTRQQADVRRRRPRHRRRLRRAERARRPAALADRELQPRVRHHRGAQRRPRGRRSGRCRRSRCESRRTRRRLTAFSQAPNPLVTQLRPAARQLSPTLQQLQRARARPQRAVPNLNPLIDASKAGLPATSSLPRRAARRCWPQSTPPLRQLNPPLQGLGQLQARADRVLRQHGGGDAGDEPGRQRERALPAHDQPGQPGERSPSIRAACRTNRPNPYTLPGAFDSLRTGLLSYETRQCTNGPLPTLVANPHADPGAAGGQHPAASSSAPAASRLPAPACMQQPKFPFRARPPSTRTSTGTGPTRRRRQDGAHAERRDRHPSQP